MASAARTHYRKTNNGLFNLLKARPWVFESKLQRWQFSREGTPTAVLTALQEMYPDDRLFGRRITDILRVPYMLDPEQRAKLSELGYTKDDILVMNGRTALRVLEEAIAPAQFNDFRLKLEGPAAPELPPRDFRLKDPLSHDGRREAKLARRAKGPEKKKAKQARRKAEREAAAKAMEAAEQERADREAQIAAKAAADRGEAAL